LRKGRDTARKWRGGNTSLIFHLIARGCGVTSISASGTTLLQRRDFPNDAAMSRELPPPRLFTETDQIRFARLSGDWNPMHMDPIVARRTQAGAPVVHGVHLALWAMDALIAAGVLRGSIASIRAVFNKFVYLNTPTELSVDWPDPAIVEVTILAAGVATTTVTITLGEPAAAPAVVEDAPPANTDGQAPNAPLLASMAGQTGWIEPQADVIAVASMFPAASAAVGAGRVGVIALTSRLVGMLFPGLHSVFGSLDLSLVTPGTRAGLGFRIALANVRTRLLRMTVAGSGVAGTVVAFARHDAITQRGIADIARDVDGNEFAGATALITGGSRGLGALTAKILAAGGGRVVVTYASGRNDAERLAAEIDDFVGVPTCTHLRYDAMQALGNQLGGIGQVVTQIYHFATPRIYRQKPSLFDAALFDEFVRVYLTSFHELCSVLQQQAARRLVAFFPSSVFVEAGRPRDMTEYAMAKAAGEVLCDEMSRTEGFPLALSNRLPRMLTDQTATLARVATADALQVMLPVVRAVQATVATWPEGNSQ
jgi:acyl dehydratase